MRIAVMGTGGVGGYFGAKLAQAGNDVVFVARGAHLAAMRANGLRVESAGGDIVVPKVAATDDPASLAPVDVVMFCVKLWDVERGAAQIAPLVARGGVVIPFQNGIDSAEVLTRELGATHVLGGVAYIAASIRAPGIIAHVGSMARLRVGAFDDVLTDARARIRRRVPRGGRRCRTRAGHSPRTLGKVRLPRCAFRTHLSCTAAARHRSQRPGAARDVRDGDARDDCRGGYERCRVPG